MRTIRTLLCVVGFMAAALVAHADNAAVKKRLQAKYDVLVKGFLTHDAASVDKVVAPGFTTTRIGEKTMSSKESVAALKSMMQGAPPGNVKISFKVTRVTLKDGKAIADATLMATVVAPGQDGKSHSMTSTATSQDTWIQVKGDWRILRNVDKDESALMDGKVIRRGPISSSNSGGMKKN